MKKIQQKKCTYRIQKDIRNKQLVFSKYLYFSILIILLIILFNAWFSYLYIAKGNGFIYTENVLIDLPYDANINKVFVKSGMSIQAKQPLFSYRSIQFEKLMQDIRLKIHTEKYEREFLQNTINITNKSIQATKNYLQKTKTFNDNIEPYLQKGYITVLKVGAERERFLKWKDQIYVSQIKLAQQEKDLKILDDHINEFKQNYKYLQQQYNNGIKLAPIAGIVESMKINDGQVLPKTKTAMRIFKKNHRYIFAYFNQNSWVNIKINDNIIIDLPGKKFAIGKVINILPISERLPQEFQSRFKAIERQQLVKIAVDSNILDTIPLMSTIQLYHPIGLTLLLKIKNLLNKKI